MPGMLNADSLLAGFLRNLGDADPLEALAVLQLLSESMTDAMLPHVEAARDRGETWAEIGDALGISRQAAWMRFARTAADAPTLPGVG
jgi:ATP-dependent Clp protease ATP-binding subunit ClpX